ncbi:winged helix-turn-helix domain-containing protein [Cyanobium sp. LEGE 06113]|uniref:winged helix-turn-helix domain-containing protein n=1 Tax=Cyanobium sp. LEGE 06113 TaxID=1297573 RepID=UPI001D133C7A
MDTAHRIVKRDEHQIDLSPREYSLLEYLMRNADHVLSRTQIAQHVWSFDFYGDFKVIDVYVGYLRRKIDQQGSPSLIRTVWGSPDSVDTDQGFTGVSVRAVMNCCS